MTKDPTRRAALVAGSAVLLDAAAPAEPKRVVSLNPCLDAILLAVADRAQVAALSHYARDPHSSTVAEAARTLPFTYESAEEVMALRPDLVLASRHTAPATRAALQKFGVALELFDVPVSVAASLAQVERVARLVGRPGRGAALTARIRAALTAAAPPSGARPVSVLVFQPQGFAAGDQTLIGELLRRTGFVNAAGRYGLKSWGNVSLERLIADPPDLLLSGEVSPGAPTWAERVVSHPALRALAGRMQRATFPERLLYCGGPSLITTADLLARVRRRAEAPA